MPITQLHGQPITASPVAPPPKLSFAQKIAETVGLFFITLTFFIFLIATVAGIWFFWSLFRIDSYKLAAMFLILISVSNIGGKYLLWYYTHYEFMRNS